MTVVTHLECWIPSPSITTETSGSLLTSRSVVSSWTLATVTLPSNCSCELQLTVARLVLMRLYLRQTETRFHASTTVVTWVVATRLAFTEVSSAASALSDHVHSHTNQRSFVGVHHVWQIAYVQSVGTTTLAHFVFVEALVDTHHCDVYTNVSFNLKFHRCYISSLYCLYRIFSIGIDYLDFTSSRCIRTIPFSLTGL